MVFDFCWRRIEASNFAKDGLAILMGRWISLFSVKLKKESEIERGALNRYCEIEKGKKIRRTLDDLRVR